MRFQHNPLRIEQVYRALSWERRKQVIRELRALMEARGQPVSPDYMEQVLNCSRPHPPGAEVVKAVVEYFNGTMGMSMSAEDVLPPQSEPPAAAASG